MPKIIENLKEKLMEEARLEVSRLGYGRVTIRGIASALGVGVGTVYNYFPSKEHLIASFMAEDWNAALHKMLASAGNGDLKTLLRSEYSGLLEFIKAHESLFSDPDAIHIFSSVPREYHLRLRRQLAEPVLRLLESSCRNNARFLADFLSESLLTWSASGVTEETLFSVLDPLL